jgi:UDPglucose 6-dehydrogenase
MRPDRVVIGAETERAREMLQRLYRPLYLIEAPIVFTGIEAAELTKYAANAFLAMKVTFINEMADLCEKVGPTPMTSPAASGSMAGSGANSCTPDRGSAAPAFPRTPSLRCALHRSTEHHRGWWKA